MNKDIKFTFKFDAEDRLLLELLAKQVRRSQGDTLRWLIHMATNHFANPFDWGEGDPPAG